MVQRPLSHPPIDTLYPECRTGDAYSVLPPPLSSELQRRLTEIGAQDVAPD